jgi:hypothetical protein
MHECAARAAPVPRRPEVLEGQRPEVLEDHMPQWPPVAQQVALPLSADRGTDACMCVVILYAIVGRGARADPCPDGRAARGESWMNAKVGVGLQHAPCSIGAGVGSVLHPGSSQEFTDG